MEAVNLHCATLTTGYTIKKNRWSDKDLQGQAAVVIYSMAGTGGASNVLVQETDVLIQLIQTPNNISAAFNTMKAILILFRGTTTQAGVARFDPIGPVTGPVTLQNDRKLFELTVRCVTEGE